eukprot:55739_1
MATENEKQLAMQVELNMNTEETVPKSNTDYGNFEVDTHIRTHNDPPIEEIKTPVDDNKENNQHLEADALSAAQIRKRSVHQQLRVVVDDLFAESNDPNRQSTDKLDVRKADSSVITRVTSILIDEINDDTLQFETSIIALPKSPICALLLMESIGLYQELESIIQYSIIASIIVTILVQIAAGSTLFAKQLYSVVETSYLTSDGFLNLVVISFIVIYLSQDCAQIYKMVVLLRWMKKAKKLQRHSVILIGCYLITNFLLYIFLLYYSIVQLLIHSLIQDKLQVAVSVYFILEVDDWLYNVTIEPLKILEEEIFNLSIRGAVGSKSKRLRHVTYWFWGVFIALLILQFILFLARVQENLTIPK